jgi:thymidylate kinase
MTAPPDASAPGRSRAGTAAPGEAVPSGGPDFPAVRPGPAALLAAAVRIACGPLRGGPGAGPGAAGAGDAAGLLRADPPAGPILRILAANKVPLLAAASDGEARQDPLWRAIAARPETVEALARERALKARLLGAYLPVAAALREAGIEPVLFKSPAWFPYLSSNLDVLVRPGAFSEAAAILHRLGHIRLPHYREDHKLLFRTFEGTAPALSVHLHEAVSWGRVLVAPGEAVVARGVPGEDAGVRAASPQDALAAAVAHSILETDQVRLGDLRIAAWCLARGARVDRLLDEAREGRWEAAAASGLALYDHAMRAAGGSPLLDEAASALVARALARRRWARRRLADVAGRAGAGLPMAIPRSFSKGHLLRLILSDDRRGPEEKLADLAATAWNLLATRLRLRSRPPSLITVSGPDGAGKSRLADVLLDTLRLCEVPAARVWSRGGFSAAAVAGKAIARRVAAGRLPGAADDGAKRRFLRSPLRRAVWTWIVVLEQAAALQRLRLLRLLGRTVVADRYVLDALADLTARAPAAREAPVPGRAAALLLGAVPAPDTAFLIEVPPDVAHARKEDRTSLESRRDLAAAYAAIAAAAPPGASAAGPFIRLDGSRPFEEMAGGAVEAALRRTFARFGEPRP